MQTHDDSFHEIQLNGKQLVFVFMAATVVSVVIFLIGVLVGRGVRVERAALTQAESLTDSPSADAPSAMSNVPATPIQSAENPTAAAPPPTLDELGDPKRLEDGGSSAGELKPAAPRAALVPAASRREAADATSAKAADAKPSTVASPRAREESLAPPDGSGYAVQVAALNARGEAEAIARRLSAKGYAAYVQTPGNGTPAVYRVRVGSFKTRREAETVATKLQREEQFKPWVTR